MSRCITLMILAALFFAPAGCASLQAPQQKPFTGLPYRHNGHDFRQAWKATQSPEGLVIQGVLKNTRYSRVDDLEVSVSLLGNGDRIMAKETTLLSGTTSRDEYRDFGLLLKNVAASPGDRLQFLIRYLATDGGSISFRWTSDFTADASTGVPILKAEEMPSDEG